MKQNEAVKQTFSENFLSMFIDTAFGWLFSFLAHKSMRQQPLQKSYHNEMIASRLVDCAV